MVSSGDFQKAIELINKSNNVLLTTHTRPDGDACGCLAAMGDALTALGKKAKLILPSSLPEWYEFLFAEQVPVLGQHIQLEELIQGKFGEFDLIIIVDTNSRTQLSKFDEYLKQNDKPVLVIDHHVTSDGLGDVELLDPTAAATGLIVHELFKYATWPITKKIAQSLFVGIATDTGWFRFANTDSRAHRSCAELIDAGANPTECHHNLYQNFSHERFKLMTAMLNTLELHFDNQYATQHISQRHFQQTGATHKDTENLIDECLRIGTVDTAALFVELKDGRIKCSLRSKGLVDVCKIAQKFGGGGHKMAAGAHLPGPLENAKQLIFDAVAEQLSKAAGR
jgi:phosphoesterase RecJ-like protein